MDLGAHFQSLGRQLATGRLTTSAGGCDRVGGTARELPTPEVRGRRRVPSWRQRRNGLEEATPHPRPETVPERSYPTPSAVAGEEPPYARGQGGGRGSTPHP